MKSSYEILIEPIITERATDLGQSKYPQYVFKVAKNANKVEIRQAVESIYQKPVKKVNTMNMLGKAKRVRIAMGRKASWKKAIVTMEEGQKIDDLDFGG